jgi:hypothetical protein
VHINAHRSGAYVKVLEMTTVPFCVIVTMQNSSMQWPLKSVTTDRKGDAEVSPVINVDREGFGQISNYEHLTARDIDASS